MRFRSFATSTNEDIEMCLNRGCSILECESGKCKDDPKTPEFEHLNPNIGYYNPETREIVAPANQRGGVHKDACNKECGSFFNPIEWGCYVGKMLGGCGGSTGLCDAFGAGEECLKYGKYAIIIVIGLLLFLVLRRR